MTNERLKNAFSQLSTPLVADACLRVGLPLRLSPPGIRSVIPGSHMRANFGETLRSVDVFLEAMGRRNRDIRDRQRGKTDTLH
jgi:hypothetical protein